jgi:uncharacterized protein (TIGR02594 family)
MAERFVVVAISLNVRDQPSLKGVVIGAANRGDVVDLVRKATDDYWYKVQTPGGLLGWVAHKYLRAVAPPSDSAYPWLDIALAERGVKEFTGSADNPRIVEYLSSTTLGPERNQDETYWCSAFVNWCIEKAGYEGTDSAWAKNWLQWGRKLSQPTRGCVVVFSRDTGGHVGFYMGESGDSIEVLGGNQNDEVRTSLYPKSRLLGFRLPASL